MYFLDEPYISDLLKFSSFFYNSKNKVYTNSENSINKIISKFENTLLPSKIELFKDKVKFREFLKTIYPDFFYKKVSYEDLLSLDGAGLKFPCVIKPAVGFLSFGVYTLWNEEDFKQAVLKIKQSYNELQNSFPKCVLSADNFIIEEFIEGDEYALDLYFNDKSEPVIITVYKHPFSDKYDVSDRMYITSVDIHYNFVEKFYDYFLEIGKKAELKNFPAHIEVRVKGDNINIIEVNPLRFAGWCLCDLAHYAYKINPYKLFMKNKLPVYCLDDKEVNAFVIAEVPQDIKDDIKTFDIKSFKKDLNAKILCTRKFDFRKKPLFATFFITAEKYENIEHILKLDIKNYVRVK